MQEETFPRFDGVEAPEPVIGSVFGIRWWQGGPRGQLRSPWRGGYRWGPGVNAAGCYSHRTLFTWRPSDRHHPNGAPESSCECGFYAMWDLPLPPGDAQPRMIWDVHPETSGARHGLILGIAEGFGRVLLGTHGFRAQYARPRAFALGRWVSPDPDVEAAADAMHLPVYRSIGECLARWREAITASRSLVGPATAA